MFISEGGEKKHLKNNIFTDEEQKFHFKRLLKTR